VHFTQDDALEMDQEHSVPTYHPTRHQREMAYEEEQVRLLALRAQGLQRAWHASLNLLEAGCRRVQLVCSVDLIRGLSAFRLTLSISDTSLDLRPAEAVFVHPYQLRDSKVGSGREAASIVAAASSSSIPTDAPSEHS
jgi:hypothetical protein